MTGTAIIEEFKVALVPAHELFKGAMGAKILAQSLPGNG